MSEQNKGLNRNIIELSEIDENSENISDIIKQINNNTTELNFILRSLAISNIDGELIQLSIGAGETVKVSHKLRIQPKFRLILSQKGGGVIKDGNFTANYVEFINDGADTANIVVKLLKA